MASQGASQGGSQGASQGRSVGLPTPLEVLGAKCVYWIAAWNTGTSGSNFRMFNMGVLGAARDFVSPTSTLITDMGQLAVTVSPSAGSLQTGTGSPPDFPNPSFCTDWVACRQSTNAARTFSEYHTNVGSWHRTRTDGTRMQGGFATAAGSVSPGAALPALDFTAKHRLFRSRLTSVGGDWNCDGALASAALANAGVNNSTTHWRCGYGGEVPTMYLRELVVARGEVTDAEVAAVDAYMQAAADA